MPREGDWFCCKCADKQFGKNAVCRNCGAPQESGVKDIWEVPNVVNKFLNARPIDREVRDQFSALSEDQQKMVMESGSLQGARDASAVLRQRMNDLMCPRKGDWYCPVCMDLQFSKNAQCRTCGRDRTDDDLIDGGNPQLPDPQSFLDMFDIDPVKMEHFFSMERAKQDAVIAKGTLKGARDPTAVLVKRMNEVCNAAAGLPTERRRGKGGFFETMYDSWMGSSGGDLKRKANDGPREGDWYCTRCQDVQFGKNSKCRMCGADRSEVDTGERLEDIEFPDAESFISPYDVDPEKKAQFLAMSEEAQRDVIMKGSLKHARDPTAVLVARMNMVLTARGGTSAVGKLAGAREGDWYCSVCHDLQFARNAQCRTCGGARADVEASGPSQLPSAEEFVEGHDIDEEKKRSFLSMDRTTQQAIIAKGTLTGSRDPTAVLVSRMKQVHEAKRGAKGSDDRMRSEFAKMAEQIYAKGQKDAYGKAGGKGYGAYGGGGYGGGPYGGGKGKGYGDKGADMAYTMGAMMMGMMGKMGAKDGGKGGGKGKKGKAKW